MNNKIVLEANNSNYETLIGFIEEYLSNVAVDKSTVLRILTACEEIIVNIIKYAYPEEKGNIEIDIEIKEDDFRIIFSDYGIPFDPLKKEDANVELGIDERRAGGLGIFLVKNIMDDVKYEYIDKKNILTAIRKISK